MDTMDLVLTAALEFLDLLMSCAIAVATSRIVTYAGATCHITASVMDSTFVRYFVKNSMLHLFSIAFILLYLCLISGLHVMTLQPRVINMMTEDMLDRTCVDVASSLG